MESPAAIDPVIAAAIRERRRLRFDYNGTPRLVEPQCYGIGSRGTELLRAHQLQGRSQREPLFDVSKMGNVLMTDERFVAPGPNYKRGDSAMRVVFCEL